PLDSTLTRQVASLLSTKPGYRGSRKNIVTYALSEFPNPERASIIDLVAEANGVPRVLPRQLGAIPAAYPPVIVARRIEHDLVAGTAREFPNPERPPIERAIRGTKHYGISTRQRIGLTPP